MKKKIVLILLACVIMLAFAACDDQKTPSLVVEGKTASTITVTAVEGAEYSNDGGLTWQDENVFDGLNPSTIYSITIRMKATEDKKASKMATAVQITTLAKGTQVAPTLEVTKTATTITVEAVARAEYRINEGVWLEAGAFGGLTPDTEYTVAIRLAETAELAASPATEEIVRTNAAIPLAVPQGFNLDEEDGEITWGSVTDANKYIVTVDLEDGGNMGSENTVVRVVEFPYDIEVTGTSLALSKLPYDCDLSITVRAANTSAEYATSEATTAVTHNRGSIFESVCYSEMAILAPDDIRYFANFRLVQDLVIAPISQGSYTQTDATKAYNSLFNGTSEEKKIATAAIGNDYTFMFYEKDTEIKYENTFAKNKFWNGLVEKTPGEEEHTIVDAKNRPLILGLAGYTLSKDNEYRTATHFRAVPANGNGGLKASDFYGKTVVMEIGILLDGIYYGHVTPYTFASSY